MASTIVEGCTVDDIERPRTDEARDDEPEPPRAPEPSTPSSLAAIADGVERPVDPNWVTVTRLTSAMVAFVIAVPALGGGVVAAVFPGRIGGLAGGAIAVLELAVVGILSWSAIVLPRLRYRHLRYCVDDDGIAIRRGVWWRADARVPRSRVQHTDVTQGPIERSFGLATLVVFTAGTHHARVSLEGLREETARAIRDFLVAGGGGDGV